MKKYILSFISLVILTACNSFDELGIKNEGENNITTTEKVVVSANIKSAGNTRVAMTPETDANENSYIKTDWKESGEKFLVYGAYDINENNANATYKEFNQVSGNKNKFEGELPYGTKHYAFYNSILKGGTNGSHTFILNYDLSEQDGTLSDDSNVLMMGETQTSSNTVTFDFTHMSLILKPTFKYKEVGTNQWIDMDSSIAKIEMGNVQYAKISGIQSSDADLNQTITITPSEQEQDDIYIFLPKLQLFPFSSSPGMNSRYKVNYEAGHTFTFTVTTKDNKTFKGSFTLPASPTLDAGKFYTATIKLAETCSYLPVGDVFKTKLVEYIKNSGKTVTDIKFVANSSNTEGEEFVGIREHRVTGSPVYFYINGNAVEIHSAAEKFVFHQDCSGMFLVNNNNDSKLLEDIENINFANCDTSKVTTMKQMFYGCRKLANISSARFDASNVTDMSYMFYYCGYRDGQPTTGGYAGTIFNNNSSIYNTSKVTNMASMFEGFGFAEIDISNFDMSKVTSVEKMFCSALYLGSINLGKFNVPGDCTLTNMFSYTGGSSNYKGYAKTTVTINSQCSVISKLKDPAITNYDTTHVVFTTN